MPSTLPLEVQVRGSEARQLVRRVLDVIRVRKGRENAISMHEVAELTGSNARTVQAIVKFLVEERHVPIGTSTTRPFGYFRLANNDERRAVRNHFVRRGLSNLQHARAYDSDSIVAPLIGQIEIDFPEISGEKR